MEDSIMQDKAKASIKGHKDSGVAGLTAALNALSMGVKEVTVGAGGEQDSEMCEVLSYLGIVPGEPATPAAIEAVNSWVQLEEQNEVAKALAVDAKAALNEQINNNFTEDSDPDEEEVNDRREVESAGGRKLMAPPPYSDLSEFFGPLEQYAQSAGKDEAEHLLRKAKMSFLAAQGAKPV